MGSELGRWGILKGVVRRLSLSPQADERLWRVNVTLSEVLLSFAVVGGLCFESGLTLGGTPPPLEVSRLSAPLPPGAPPPMRATAAAPAAERASLTVAEQRARQAIKVTADRRAVEDLRRDARFVDETYDERLAALKKRLQTDQESRVARDKAALEAFDGRVLRERDSLARRLKAMEMKLAQDEEGLAELTRVERERGASALAVQLGVFPAQGPGVDPSGVAKIPGVPAASSAGYEYMDRERYVE